MSGRVTIGSSNPPSRHHITILTPSNMKAPTATSSHLRSLFQSCRTSGWRLPSRHLEYLLSSQAKFSGGKNGSPIFRWEIPIIASGRFARLCGRFSSPGCVSTSLRLRSAARMGSEEIIGSLVILTKTLQSGLRPQYRRNSGFPLLIVSAPRSAKIFQLTKIRWCFSDEDVCQLLTVFSNCLSLPASLDLRSGF